MTAHIQYAAAAQVRSTGIPSPDRRGGLLAGPSLPHVAWTTVSCEPVATVPREGAWATVSCEPVATVPREQQAAVAAPPFALPLAQQAVLTQQAYVSLGQALEVPTTARPHPRRDGSARGTLLPQRNTASAQALHTPGGGSVCVAPHCASAAAAPGMMPGAAMGGSISGHSPSNSVQGRAGEECTTARPAATSAGQQLNSSITQQSTRSTGEGRRQQSLGSCSGNSAPCGSPAPGQREQRNVVEVPLVIMDRQSANHDTSENVKQMSQDMKWVKDKVSEIESFMPYIKASDQDRIAALKSEIELNKYEAQRAKESEQKAHASASAAAAQLADKVRAFDEVKSALRQREQQLEAETVAHERTRHLVEEAQRSAHERDRRWEEAQKAAHEREFELQEVHRAAQNRVDRLQEKLGEAQDKIHESQELLKEQDRQAQHWSEILSEKEQAAQKWEEMYREAELALKGGNTHAETVASLQVEAREKDHTITECENKLRALNEECNSYKVRHNYLELQIDQKTTEITELRKKAEQATTEAQHRALELGQLTERLERERAARVREQRETESQLGDLGAQRVYLEAERQQLRERLLEESRGHDDHGLAERLRNVGEREALLAVREASLAQGELNNDHALAERLRSVGEREAVLAVREASLAQGEVNTMEERDSFRREQELHQERIQELERQLTDQREQQREQQRQCPDYEKENRALKQTLQEQKLMLFSLESQLHREQALANFLTPGELLKMTKREAGETTVHENALLLLRNHHLQTEVREVRWHNDVMRRNLPRSVWDSVAVELSRPLPVREPAAEAGN